MTETEEKICSWCGKPITNELYDVEELHARNDGLGRIKKYYHYGCYAERTGDSKKHAFDHDSEYKGRKQKCPDCESETFRVMEVSGWNGRKVWLTCVVCGKRFPIPSGNNCPAHETNCPQQTRIWRGLQ